MGRVITQTLRQRAADPDGIFVNGTFSAGAITLDGALASGGIVDFAGDGFLPVKVGFTTGLTGSTANATVTGTDFFGNPLTETVVLPGASSTVSTVNQFRSITAVSIDGAATNLSAGVLATDDQEGPWTPHNIHQSHFSVSVDVDVIGGTLVGGTMQHCLEQGLMRNGPTSVQNPFTAAAPFASFTTDTQGSITDTAFTASRVVIGAASTAAVLRVKWLQAGNTD